MRFYFAKVGFCSRNVTGGTNVMFTLNIFLNMILRSNTTQNHHISSDHFIVYYCYAVFTADCKKIFYVHDKNNDY